MPNSGELGVVIAIPCVFFLYFIYLTVNWIRAVRSYGVSFSLAFGGFSSTMGDASLLPMSAPLSGHANEERKSSRWENTFYLIISLSCLGRAVEWTLIMMEESLRSSVLLPLVAQLCSIGFISGTVILVFYWSERYADLQLAFGADTAVSSASQSESWIGTLAFRCRALYTLYLSVSLFVYLLSVTIVHFAVSDDQLTYTVGQSLVIAYSAMSAVLFVVAGKSLVRQVAALTLTMTSSRKAQMKAIQNTAVICGCSEALRVAILIIAFFLVDSNPNVSPTVVYGVSFGMYLVCEIIPTIMLVLVMRSGRRKGPPGSKTSTTVRDSAPAFGSVQ
eukprot:ANDGO_07780.mRNA.1 hypothetical protein